MNDLFEGQYPEPHEPPLDGEQSEGGFRLHRLEVFNWGTFDERVHVLNLDGQTTLLVGQNGAGKSTLVDALLTLLVRPGKTRNYNLAAGASKTERSEKSYIQGAYDRRSHDEDNRGEVRYLRSSAGTCSVLLGVFRNRETGKVFTLAQLLYISDGAVERVYCYAEEDRSIARHCAGLKGMEKVTQEMKKRGFKASAKYSDYFEWFRKATSVKEQAMDMFNQTVAVKDIQRLNDFIRKHMLEAKPWNDKVDELFGHFKDLSEAHQALERVRKQRDLLEPIEKHGKEYQKQAAALDRCNRWTAAAESYFPQKYLNLFTPELERRQIELTETKQHLDRVLAEIKSADEERLRIRTEIDLAGGERLRQIPLEIATHEAERNSRRANFDRYMESLRRAEVSGSVEHEEAFIAVREYLTPLAGELQKTKTELETKRSELIEARVDPKRAKEEAEKELAILARRQGNLPPEYVEIRRQLCEDLRFAERDLPFAAELISVKSEERDWESSIEMVLRQFGLSLLVPQKHYAAVGRYLEKTPLRDARGHGQKLVYLQIGERAREAQGPQPERNSLFWKLAFREKWSALLPWVKVEICERFNYRCCETIEEFQQAAERALTKNRHLKHNFARHEKDDRARVADPRHYVLGWDNEEKKRLLSEAIAGYTAQLEQIDKHLTQIEQQTAALQIRLIAIDSIRRFASFSDIDYHTSERAIAELRKEKQAIEENSDVLKLLKSRLGECEQRLAALDAKRTQIIGDIRTLETGITQTKAAIKYNQDLLAKAKAKDDYSALQKSYPELDAHLSSSPITVDNFTVLQRDFEKLLVAQKKQIEEEIAPARTELQSAMGKFLRANPDESLDLQSDVRYLPDFLAFLQRIRDEDLPRFEEKFKERLNEKVGHEIGVLRGNLSSERRVIEDRIDDLNRSLRLVQYSPGRHMKLVAKNVKDREITAFRQELDACVSGQFEGTLAADEARYKQIASLIGKLRDEQPWRLRVTDVRNWFDFAAVETDDVSGAECSYHDDSAGQSGGEKAKLAFTILIAAIAFQYDLDPQRPRSDRFHFVVVDEMFSRVDDSNSAYALELFRRFGLQLLIVAPLDAKARVTEDYVGCYLHVSKDEKTNRSQVLQMTAREFHEQSTDSGAAPRPRRPR